MRTCMRMAGLYKFFGSRNLANFFLSSAEPKYGKTLRSGQNLASSFYQLCRVVTGTTIKKGPQTFFFSARCAIKEMAYIVLPSPISSAKTVFLLSCQALSIQLSPAIW